MRDDGQHYRPTSSRHRARWHLHDVRMDEVSALAWRPAAELVPGDRIARTVAYKPTQHPSLLAIAHNSPDARAIVESNNTTHVGWHRVIFRIGSTRIARTWAPESILAIESTQEV